MSYKIASSASGLLSSLINNLQQAIPPLFEPDLAESIKRRKQMDNGGISAAIPAGLTVFFLSAESDGITGKFIAAQWDPWREKTFQDRLRADKDFATIRRIDDKTFFKK